MTWLLDTCTILWAGRRPDRLAPRIRALLVDAHEEFVFSVASAWEVALKPKLGIAEPTRWFQRSAENLQARILPIRLEHIAALQKLPFRHRDPFDRLLIAQAVADKLTLITADEAIQSYPEVTSVWE